MLQLKDYLPNDSGNGSGWNQSVDRQVKLNKKHQRNDCRLNSYRSIVLLGQITLSAKAPGENDANDGYTP